MFKGNRKSQGVFARGRVLALLTALGCATFGVPAGGCGGEEMDAETNGTLSSSNEELFRAGRKGRFIRKDLPYDCTVNSPLESCPDIEN